MKATSACLVPVWYQTRKGSDTSQGGRASAVRYRAFGLSWAYRGCTKGISSAVCVTIRDAWHLPQSRCGSASRNRGTEGWPMGGTGPASTLRRLGGRPIRSGPPRAGSWIREAVVLRRGTGTSEIFGCRRRGMNKLKGSPGACEPQESGWSAWLAWLGGNAGGRAPRRGVSREAGIAHLAFFRLQPHDRGWAGRGAFTQSGRQRPGHGPVGPWDALPCR